MSRALAWGEDVESKAKVVVRAGAETPFLIDGSFGNGHVLLFCTSADRSWATFPLSPIFLPLVHQVVQYGAGLVGAASYMETTRSLSISEYLPWAKAESVLYDPAGNKIPIRGSLSEGRVLLRAENLTEPGIYSLSIRPGIAPKPALALNLDRTESDLTRVELAEIPEMLGVENVNVVTSREELATAIEEHRIGRTLGELMLWIAFIIGAVEVFYANWRAKSTPGLSHGLSVDASGRVHEVKEATEARPSVFSPLWKGGGWKQMLTFWQDLKKSDES
jgi:hypothetical protein